MQLVTQSAKAVMPRRRGGSAPSGPVQRRKVADLALGGLLVFAGIPIVFTLQWRVADIPVINLGYALIVLLVAVEYIRRLPGQRMYLLLYICGGLIMGAVALLNTDDTRFRWYFAFQDCAAYSGLPVGIAWAYLRGPATAVALLWRGYVLVTIVFAVGMVLLIEGYVPNSGNAERLLDGAFFNSVVFLTMCFPVLWLRVGSKWSGRKLVVACGPVLCGWFAVASATRSVAIGAAASVCCVVVIEMRRKMGTAIALAAFLLFVVLASTLEYRSWDTLEDSHLAARANRTDLTTELRVVEFVGLISQMEWPDWVYGGGFGRGFDTPIQLGLTTAPHIGFSTLLYKAGAPLFVVLMLGPCIIGAYRFVVGRDGPQMPFLAAIVVYLSQACVSWGWTFIPLYLLGTFLALTVFSGRNRTRVNRMGVRAVYYSVSARSTGMAESVVGRNKVIAN